MPYETNDIVIVEFAGSRLPGVIRHYHPEDRQYVVDVLLPDADTRNLYERDTRAGIIDVKPGEIIAWMGPARCPERLREALAPRLDTATS